MHIRKQQLELVMEQQTGSKSGKEYVKAIYYYPVSLTYMQSMSYKMQSWMNHKLEPRLPEGGRKSQKNMKLKNANSVA